MTSYTASAATIPGATNVRIPKGEKRLTDMKGGFLFEWKRKKSKTSEECYVYGTKSTKAYYGNTNEDSVPGDIVMAYAADIDHPAYKAKTVAANYIIFGAVNRFAYRASDVDKHNELLDVQWAAVDGKQDYKIRPVHNWETKVVVKWDTLEVEGMNDFVKDAVYQNFYWKRREGWFAHVR